MKEIPFNEEVEQWGNLLKEQCPVFEQGFELLDQMGKQFRGNIPPEIGAALLMTNYLNTKPDGEKCPDCPVKGECHVTESVREML